MLDLVTFFNTINVPTALSAQSTAVMLLIFFGLFAGLEQRKPYRKLPRHRLHRSYLINIGLFVVNGALMSLLLASLPFMPTPYYAHPGLLRYLANPVWQFLAGFLLLDLLLYGWHRACHRFDSLWLFHRVHHNDPDLNASTAVRIHVLELLLTNMLKAGYVVLLGVDQVMMLVNEAVITVFTLFHHANIAFAGEKWLGKVFIVPYLHRTHHSTARHEHDSNYGAVFALWDRLFRTVNEKQPVAIGLQGDSPQTLIQLLRFGFNMHTPTAVTPPLPANLDIMIAEAAYYRAKQRDFLPGYELLDWLEAKKDILKCIYGDHPAKQRPKKYGLMVLN
jgi:sterol desaturase/sphingolipid hydroxylase (fatty acid hydroxylase superfamily)